MNEPFDLLRDVDDGDLVAVRSRNGGLPALTRFFTRSPYTHTAVVIRLDGEAWLAEMSAGGNNLIPLARRAAQALDVFGFPGDRHLVRRCVLESLGRKISYDFMDLIRIAAWNLVQFELPRSDRGGMVCSAYSAALWQLAGVALKTPVIASPADLVAAVIDHGATVLHQDVR